MTGARVILLDIEGTTTPIAFVYDVLFPFVRTRVEDFLTRSWTSAACQLVVAQLREEYSRDRAAEALPPWVDDPPASQMASVVAYTRWLMDRDRKSTALKALQGLIWEEGYRSGELEGVVFPDVRPAFERWQAQGRRIGIFSSGSVLAQKLLFGHSTAGDLTPWIQWYFDTEVGAKQDPGSYSRIADILGASADAVLFVSDSVRELDAARTACMQTHLSLRPGNANLVEHPRHTSITSFDEIL